MLARQPFISPLRLDVGRGRADVVTATVCVDQPEASDALPDQSVALQLTALAFVFGCVVATESKCLWKAARGFG